MGMTGRPPANLAELLVSCAQRHPQHRFAVADAEVGHGQLATLGGTLEVGGRLAATLAELGLRAGTRVALIGPTSSAYLLWWAGLQLSGAEVALVNPSYPAALIAEILRPLAPEFVVWVHRDLESGVASGARHIEGADVGDGTFVVDGDVASLGETPGDLPGLARRPLDVAGWMHTSGTTGVPKLCTQSHEYFLRLGRFVADTLALSERDLVFAPLPLFHINPLGYGVVGALVGHSEVVGWERFSARRFWPLVRDLAATSAILHAPPVEILKQTTTAGDAAGHHLRSVLYADPDFLEQFDIPLGLSVYGSTEVGGLSHTWSWRRGESSDVPEGAARYGGRARADVRWTLADDGEILISSDRPGVLFSGYLSAAGVQPVTSPDGWFHTGDLGRVDEFGNLVFLERAAEAIRVKGEYVPIGYVEERLRTVAGIDDLALWRRDNPLVDHDAVLYIDAPRIPADQLVAAAETLPRFMRPTVVLRVDGRLPRDAGVGKVRRRDLASLTVLEERELSYP